MIEVNNTTAQKINLGKTKKIVENFLRVYKKSNWEVSIAIIGSGRMQKLNNDYRGINKTTDVLSFTGAAKAKQGLEKKYLGEVIINNQELKKFNKYLEVFGEKKSADYIFYFLLVHGLLHLVGYNDDKESDRQTMLILGRKFLEKYL